MGLIEITDQLRLLLPHLRIRHHAVKWRILQYWVYLPLDSAHDLEVLFRWLYPVQGPDSPRCVLAQITLNLWLLFFQGLYSFDRFFSLKIFLRRLSHIYLRINSLSFDWLV